MAFERELEYPYGSDVAVSRSSERALFIRRTYAHLAGALLAFIGLEALLVTQVPNDVVVRLFGGGGFSWLIVLAAFMGASWLARMWAQSGTSTGMQYLGLGLYVVAEAIICWPLVWVASMYTDKTIIPTAGILTLAVFGGLTMSVLLTGKDYSPLRPILSVACWIAFGVIIAACIFGFSLGLLFSFAMVALLAGMILYQTSQIILHWPTNMYVAAALELFASIATLFWYILRILMLLNSRD